MVCGNSAQTIRCRNLVKITAAQQIAFLLAYQSNGLGQTLPTLEAVHQKIPFPTRPNLLSTRLNEADDPNGPCLVSSFWCNLATRKQTWQRGSLPPAHSLMVLVFKNITGQWKNVNSPVITEPAVFLHSQTRLPLTSFNLFIANTLRQQ